ncbi:MAG: class I SAM-dependent methyltransferase [Desulfobacteraceae bacterium]|nr:class I SAM-dependent methyltransferase [Desulfobacteraceae bacterium]
MTHLIISRQKSKSDAQSPKYGYYYFTPYVCMLAVFVLTGAAAMAAGAQLNSRVFYYLGLATAVYGILTTAGWALARYVIPGNRVTVARQIIRGLKLKGSEQILDVGSGRGLYAIEAAKKLTTGQVKAIDIWDSKSIKNVAFHHKLSQPTGNTIDNAMQNATREGVAPKIEFRNMDAAHLEYADESFDIVICGFIIGHLWQSQDKVLKEIKRVLKYNARIVLIDNVRDITYFLLSTPHMFLWSWLRGRKAKRLSEQNWFKTIVRANFAIRRWKVRKGIIIIEGKK